MSRHMANFNPIHGLHGLSDANCFGLQLDALFGMNNKWMSLHLKSFFQVL
jgi:hypothetical protein